MLVLNSKKLEFKHVFWLAWGVGPILNLNLRDALLQEVKRLGKIAFKNPTTAAQKEQFEEA